MIETANAPLLELHDAYERFDSKLPHMYDPVEDVRTATSLLAASRFAQWASRLCTLVALVGSRWKSRSSS